NNCNIGRSFAQRYEIWPRRQQIRGLDAPNETEPGQRHQHPPTGVGFPLLETELRRRREGVVVVVPGFTHRDQPTVGHVVALHARAADVPGAATNVMPVIHTDLLTCQCTEPVTASVPSPSRVRTLRNDPSALRKASSTGSGVTNLGPDSSTIAHLRPDEPL